MHDTELNLDYFFSSSYEEARKKFLNLSDKLGITIFSFQHPSITTESGDPLTIDASWLGPRDAKNVLVMLSGTHGPESYTGSAIQLSWLQQQEKFTSSSLAVLNIHGVNPFGWAFCSRTNENNVDLNRNFVDFEYLIESHPLTKPIQETLSQSTENGPNYISISFGLIKSILKNGLKSVSDSISNGQYICPEGIGYGGQTTQWSNEIVTNILKENLIEAEQVAIIDWHTGIGDYGKPCLLCFDDPSTPSYTRACSWWSKGVDKSDQSYVSGKRPDYQGLLINSARDIAQHHGATTTSAVIEFGTYGNLRMLNALIIDRWLRSLKDHDRKNIKEIHKKKILDAFYPDDPLWRASVLNHSHRIIDEAIDGLNKQCDY